MRNGFLNINKPDGITSFGVVAKLRKKFNIQKIGHMGTLDPAGCGVLPLAIGKATRLFSLMQEKRKKYRAIFVFGKETDTLDAEGQVINQIDKIFTREEIVSVLPKFIGKISQIPPNFSAKKVNGKRAYELARNNQEVILSPKNIEIFSFDIIEELGENQYLFEIECSAGTYIRSLCRDLARELNTCAYMPLIIRIACDDFKLENSIPLNSILNGEKMLEDYLIPLEKVFHLDKIDLNSNDYKKIRNGLEIKILNALSGLKYLTYENRVFAIGKVSNDKLKMEIYLDD